MDKSPINWVQPPGQTCRVEAKSGKIYGLFYDSKSKLRHIADFKPYAMVPRITLCGDSYVNFSATGITDNVCNTCEEQLKRILHENL